MSSQQQQQTHIDAFASSIGINLPRESFLISIAEEGFHSIHDSHNSILPEGWEEHEADDHNRSKYFYNTADGTSQWEHPSIEYFKQQVVSMRNLVHQCAAAIGIDDDQQNSTDPQFESYLLHHFAAEMAFCEMPENWQSHDDGQGNVYFENPNGESTWEHPYQEYYFEQVSNARSQRGYAGGASANSSNEPFGNNNNNNNSGGVQHQHQQHYQKRSMPQQYQNHNNNNLNHRTTSPSGSPPTRLSGKDFLKQQRPKKFEPLASTDQSYADHSKRYEEQFHPILGAPCLRTNTRYDHETNKSDYDEVWGPPFPPRFDEHRLSQKGPSVEYDEWFGMPVRKRPGVVKPSGPPKRAGGNNNGPNSLLQRQQEHERLLQQQQLQQQTSGANQNQNSAQQQITALMQNPQIVGFAQYLGVNLQNPHLDEKPLVIVAAMLFQTPLPPVWRPVQDPTSKRTYFVNMQSNQTTWDHPMKEEYSKKIIEERQNLVAHEQQIQIETKFPPIAAQYFGVSDLKNFLASFAGDPDGERKKEEILAILGDAEEFLSSSNTKGVQPGWSEHHTEDGHVYYANLETEETSWDFPTHSVIVDLKNKWDDILHSSEPNHYHSQNGNDYHH